MTNTRIVGRQRQVMILVEACKLGRCSSCGDSEIAGGMLYGWCSWCIAAPITKDPQRDNHNVKGLDVCPVVNTITTFFRNRNGWQLRCGHVRERSFNWTSRARVTRMDHTSVVMHDVIYHGKCDELTSGD